MVRIRLRRTGAKNDPTFRIVVADQRAPRDGAFLETLGHYLPTRNPHVLEIDAEKARRWLRNGAQPSETAASLLKQKGILTADGKIADPDAPAPAPAAPATGSATASATAPIAAPADAAPATVDTDSTAPAPAIAAEPTSEATSDAPSSDVSSDASSEAPAETA